MYMPGCWWEGREWGWEVIELGEACGPGWPGYTEGLGVNIEVGEGEEVEAE